MQTNKKNNKEISYLIRRYFPYWPYFLISLAACISLAFLYLKWALPVYEISASILIKDSNPNNSNTNAQFIPSLEAFSSNKTVENETQVLQSREIMDAVVKKLDLYAPIFRKKFLGYASAYTSSPVRIEILYPDSLRETKARVPFTYQEKDRKILISSGQYPVSTWVDTRWGMLRFVPNPDYIPDTVHKTSQFYFSLISAHKVANGLLYSLDVEQTNRLSTTIDLSLKDAVPKRGEDILNELILFYNIKTTQDKDKLAINALNFLDQRLQYVSAGLDSIENVLQSFKASSGVVNLSEQGRLILGSVQTNDQKLSEMNVQLAMLNQVKTYLHQDDNNPDVIPVTNVSNDDVLSKYLESLYNAEIQYEQLRKTTAQNNPILLSLRDQIAKIKPTILQYVTNQINTLEAAKADLNANAGQYASQLRTIPEKERELLELSRQQTIKNDLYTFLLQKREDAALAYAASVNDDRVIDKPQAGINPVSPQKMLVMTVAFIFGLGIPLVLVFFNKKIISREEVTAILNFPVIGEISYTGRKRLLADKDKREFIGEEFRQIRTSLLSRERSSYQKKWLVTSSVPGEGKSFIASNLAFNLALAGKKVILLELDLRKPRLGELFNLKGKPGVSEFLVDNADPEEIIYTTSLHKNFYFIPAGHIPANPSDLLLNGRLKELLAYLQDIFDYVIVETTPVGLFSDGYIISEQCDLTLFVVRFNVTPKSELLSLSEHLKVKSLKNPAIILNGVRTFGTDSYRYKYYSYIKQNKKNNVLDNLLVK